MLTLVGGDPVDCESNEGEKEKKRKNAIKIVYISADYAM